MTLEKFCLLVVVRQRKKEHRQVVCQNDSRSPEGELIDLSCEWGNKIDRKKSPPTLKISEKDVVINIWFQY